MEKWSKDELLVLFDELEDPRIERHKKYPINEIVFLTLYAALINVESWRAIRIVGKERLDFLKKFFEFKNGIPSHQTLGRVFSLLRPQSFEIFFRKWTSLVYGESCEGKHIAIDGKTVRGSFDKSKNQAALHLLNACSVDNGILLAQMKVNGKTNEITVVPEILDSLDIKGAMISVDALNTQKENAAKIVNSKADYTLALKGNHKNLNDAVEQLFRKSTLEKSPLETVEKEHGRHTTRVYDVIDVDKYNLPQAIDWKGLVAVGRVQTLCLQSKSQNQETRYYLLSYSNLELFAKSARKHWGVESYHWILDVTFSEDSSRKRKDHAPQNFSLIRKFAINILKSFKEKLSISLTRIKSALNPEFIQDILIKSGFKLRSGFEF